MSVLGFEFIVYLFLFFTYRCEVDVSAFGWDDDALA